LHSGERESGWLCGEGEAEMGCCWGWEREQEQRRKIINAKFKKRIGAEETITERKKEEKERRERI
jgi:hypothetical protein